MSDAAEETSIAALVRSRAHWHVTMRPPEFDRELIKYSELEGVMASVAVALRGWDVPHVDDRQPVLRGDRWIGRDADWQHHVEVWRLYQSGQLVHLKGVPTVWRDRSTLWPPPADDNSQRGALGVTDMLWSLGEYFELASRFTLALPGDRLVLRIRVSALTGHELVVDDPMRAPFAYPRTTAANEFDTEEREYTSEQLVSNGRAIAVTTAVELFARFGWAASEDLLRENLDQLFTRR